MLIKVPNVQVSDTTRMIKETKAGNINGIDKILKSFPTTKPTLITNL